MLEETFPPQRQPTETPLLTKDLGHALRLSSAVVCASATRPEIATGRFASHLRWAPMWRTVVILLIPGSQLTIASHLLQRVLSEKVCISPQFVCNLSSLALPFSLVVELLVELCGRSCRVCIRLDQR